MLGLVLFLIIFSGVEAASSLFINNVKYADASGNTYPTPKPTHNPVNKNYCQPGKETAEVNQLISFSTSSGNANTVWSASGGSPSSGTGISFSTSFPAPGNYRVSNNSDATTCFVHVIGSTPTPMPEPTFVPMPTPHNRPFNEFPKPTHQPWPTYTPLPEHHFQPEHPYKHQMPNIPTTQQSECPGGWVKQTRGVATICLPESQQQEQNQNQEQIQNQNQSQNQVQTNNQNQNVNTNVVATGGNSSSTSNSSNWVNISVH